MSAGAGAPGGAGARGAGAGAWVEEDVRVGERRLHLRRAGDGRRPVLLLHGLGASGVVWQNLGRRLLPEWSPIAADLPGHGGSDPAPPGGYAPEALAGSVEGLLTHVGGGRVPVVGHSLGALVALALAVFHAERVTGVVLLDPPLDAGRRNPDVAEVYRLRKAPAGALEAYLAEGTGSPLAAQALAPVFRRAEDAAFEAHLGAPAGAPWAWDEAPHVRAPVLVVQADPAVDGVLGDEAAEGFVARLPRGELLKVAGARHAVHASHPQPVAQAIRRFLSGLDV